MTPGDHRGRPGEGAPWSSNVLVGRNAANSTEDRRQDHLATPGLSVLRREVRVERTLPPAGWHVGVQPVTVTAASGKQSGHAVWSCPWCGCAHRVVLPVPVPDRVARRRPCTGQRITVHIAAVTA